MVNVLSNGSGGGDWNAYTTWNGGNLPDFDNSDTVEIVAGDTVNINIALPDLTGKITNGGTLQIASNGSVTLIPSGITIYQNEGTITTLQGIVTTNNGIITNIDSGGTVDTNTGDITTNTGVVTDNNAGGVITTNEGTVTTNNADVITNNDTINTNDATGTVTTNSATGIIDLNTGGGQINNNSGTVTLNKSSISNHAGIITTNSGDAPGDAYVSCLAAGVISNQNVATIVGDPVLSSSWTITGGDFSGCTSITVNSTGVTISSVDSDIALTGQTINNYGPLTFNVVNAFLMPASVVLMSTSASLANDYGTTSIASTVIPTSPAVVKLGTSYDGATKTGTMESTNPGIANVKKTTSYKIESTTLTGTMEATNPAIANVKLGTNYTIESTAYTGTLESTDPGEANVTDGVTYTIESVAKTGSLEQLSTDPGQNNVRLGTIYTILSSSKTGTMNLPAEINVRKNVAYDRATKVGSLQPKPVRCLTVQQVYVKNALVPAFTVCGVGVEKIQTL